eukprot:gene6626-4746_t
MEAAAAQYVASLQQARAHEVDRRNLRRRRRNEYLVGLHGELEARSRTSLHRHIQMPAATPSEMEKQLVEFVQKTAVWWGALCDQSIEQRLRYEKSLENQKKRREEYLKNVEQRENSEFSAVCNSEAARWDHLQSEFSDYEKAIRDSTVAAARDSIINATSQCAGLVEDYCVEKAKDNWLIQFAFKRITAEAPFSKKPDTLESEAFEAIFGRRNAYGITGTSFKELLDFSYRRCDADKRATYEFDACEVPIIMLEGAKLSGKSLLADALEKKFNLRRFNDRSLIEKALNAHPAAHMHPAPLNVKAEEDFANTNPYGDTAEASNGVTSLSLQLLSGDEAMEEAAGAQAKMDGTADFNHSVLTTDTAPPELDAAEGTAAAAELEAAVADGADGANEFDSELMASKGNSMAISAESGEMSGHLHNGATMHSLSRWVEMGNIIREKLYRGEAIDQSVTAQLLRLQLRDLSTETCSGVIFEGVLNRLVEIPALLQALVPKRTNKYNEIHKLWCEGLEEMLQEREQIKAERDAAKEAEAAAAAEQEMVATEAAAELDARHISRSPRKKHRSNSRASASSPATMEEVQADTPEPPPADVPEVLAVSRVKLDEPVKKEVRSKGPKRGVDLSQLPPPELPPVDDVEDQVRSEEEFVARALEELESYTGLLSLVMCVSCSPKEIFRRFAGLRIDKDTSEQFHLLYNPPPKERIPYLVGCDRTTSFSSQLYDVVFRQKQEWNELHQWLLRQPTLCNRVNEIEGDKPFADIEAEAGSLVQTAIDSFNVGKRLYDAMLDARQRIAALKKNRADQVAAREAERVRLAELYAEKGVPLPPELEAASDTGAWCAVPEDVPPMILKAVQEFHHHYAKTYHGSWEEFGSLSCMILEYRRSARSQLKRYWGQPDDKQAILDRFLRQFNAVPKKFRCKPPCKEELHLVTDELRANLFASVETKKRDGFLLIDHVVRRDAYLDGWEANVCNLGALLVQQEVERFTLVVNLTMLYFGAAHEEPVMFEEIDTDVNLIRTLEAATGDLAGAGKGKADKRSISARKAHGRPNDESGDSSIVEAFHETVQRLVNGITTLTEKFKLKVAADASGKGAKEAAALERIAAVKRFVTELTRQGEAYMQSIKSEMMSEARHMLMQQASAVNSAIFAIRCAIEEEDDVSPHAHWMRDVRMANAVKNPCFITDVPLYARGTDITTSIHDTLNASRLMEIIQHFRCAAPQFRLCRDSFTTTLTDDDYAGAAKEGEFILGTQEVFRLFDPMNTGAMDWRELIVHLLLWCCPPAAKGEASRYIPEVTVSELQKMKSHLGTGQVTEDQFTECPFFFDKYLKADRREVYVRALWYTFLRPRANTIDAFELLCFFCIDPQPIRGVQKAFCLFSDRGDMLTMGVLERILHVRATNARAMALVDPFSKPNLYILMGKRDLIAFKDACASAMGRCLFNKFDFMMRKRQSSNINSMDSTNVLLQSETLVGADADGVRSGIRTLTDCTGSCRSHSHALCSFLYSFCLIPLVSLVDSETWCRYYWMAMLETTGGAAAGAEVPRDREGSAAYYFRHLSEDQRLIARRFVGGTLGGFLQALTSHPLDTIKARLQSGVHPSVTDVVASTWREEGLRGFFRGVQMPLFLGGVFNSVLFSLNQVMRSLLTPVGHLPHEPLALWRTALAAQLATPLYVLVLTPIERVKIVMQLQNSKEKSAAGFMHAVSTIRHRSGVRGFMRGYCANVGVHLIGLPSYFVGYQVTRSALVEVIPPHTWAGHLALPVASGISAGVFFWLSCYPFDLIKTKMQATHHKCSSAEILRDPQRTPPCGSGSNTRSASCVTTASNCWAYRRRGTPTPCCSAIEGEASIKKKTYNSYSSRFFSCISFRVNERPEFYVYQPAPSHSAAVRDPRPAAQLLSVRSIALLLLLLLC